VIHGNWLPQQQIPLLQDAHNAGVMLHHQLMRSVVLAVLAKALCQVV
jgi:hypothetical protein